MIYINVLFYHYPLSYSKSPDTGYSDTHNIFLKSIYIKLLYIYTL